LTRGAESSVHPCVPAPDGSDTSQGWCGQGKGAGAVMARVAVRESATLAGRAGGAGACRRAFVREMLGPGHPCGPRTPSCVLRAAMRKGVGGFSSLRASRRGGAGGGVAGGW